MCREEEEEDAQMDRPPISATNHRNLSDHRNNNRTAADYYVLFLLSLAWLPYSRSRYAYERHKIFSHGIGVRDGAHNNIVSFLQLSPPLDSTLWHVLIWIMELPSTDRRKSPTTKCDKLLHSNPTTTADVIITSHATPNPVHSCLVSISLHSNFRVLLLQ